ncbi:21774_t:CDS:2, partial [Rhizophagus irregularis]
GGLTILQSAIMKNTVVIIMYSAFLDHLDKKAFEKNTRQIPNASSKEEVNILLQQIKDTNDDEIE